MSTPALEEKNERTRRADRIESSLRAERLRERAAAIRGLRRGTRRTSASPGPPVMVRIPGTPRSDV